MVENDDAPGPDFLCVGMGKSGTGWIYDQCQHHPAFWMPPFKEIHYLDREYPRRIAKKILGMSREMANEKRLKRGKRGLEDRDMTFIYETQDARYQPMDLERYARMFRFKGDQLSGDVTPSYSDLSEEVIGRVMARFPAMKVILLVRDPVARAWSHFCMHYRGDRVEAEQLLDPDKFRELLRESRVFRTGSPARIARKWLLHVPRDQFRYYFFEDLSSDPAKIRREFMIFLGADPDVAVLFDAAHNKKAGKSKLELKDEIRAILVEHFADELVASAEFFGSHARNWPSQYGLAVPA
jgi:hypothetical protein